MLRIACACPLGSASRPDTICEPGFGIRDMRAALSALMSPLTVFLAPHPHPWRRCWMLVLVYESVIFAAKQVEHRAPLSAPAPPPQQA